MIRGSCLCGAVSYTVAEPLGPGLSCHCKQCRKMSGHFTAAAPVPWDAVSVSGETRWYESSPVARRGFCPTCGSYLFWEQYDGLVYVMAGALDGETGLKMEGHIFYASRGDYYRVGDGLPCWAEERDGPRVDH